MAKSNWGITSEFIGKLGNVVGFNWKGKNIQRAHIVSGRKSQSEDQQLARARGVDFGEATLSGNVLTVAIDDDNLYGRRVSISDRIYIAAYCPELGDARCFIAGTRLSLAY